MPWRKYKPSKGKYGPNYRVDKGVNVRMDSREVWTIFLNKGGQRKNRSVGSGREGLVKAIKAAEVIASKVKAVPAEKEEPADAGVPLFEDYSNEWLENNRKRWRSFTHERYESILRLHIWPDKTFTGKHLDEITKKDVKRFLVGLYKKRSAATVELTHAILSGLFDEAMEDELITSNPASNLLKRILPAKIQRNEKEAEPFTIEERDKFLAQVEQNHPWDHVLILKVMAFAGLRLGEVLAMRFRNLDFTNKTYHVQEGFKRYHFSKPKKGKKRYVALPDFLLEELGRYCHHLKKEGLKAGSGSTVDLLFLDPKERYRYPYSQRKIQELVKKVCREAGLSQRNPHDLRHTYATIMLMAHQSPAFVQKQLGHSSIAMTVDVYGHWIPGEGGGGLEDALLPPVRDPGEKCIFLHMK